MNNRKIAPYLIFISFQFIALCSSAQFRTKYHGFNENNDVNGMSFLSPSTGFVAFSNFIGFTQDSGATYVKRYVGTGNTDYNGYQVNLTFGFHCAGVFAFSTDSLLAYGDFGTEPSILLSYNQGQSWKLIFHRSINTNASVFNAGITDMKFPGNSNVGFAVHNEEVVMTTNRGQSWTTVVAVPNGQMAKLSFPTPSTGYAIGYNKFYKTINGGTAWTSQTLPQGSYESINFNNVFFTSATNGYIADQDNAAIYRTIDGAATWQPANDPSINVVSGTDMVFTNDSTGYISAQYGYQVAKTTDYGKIWEVCKRADTIQYLNYGLNRLYFYNSQIGWAGGGVEFLMITTDGASKAIPNAYFTIDTSALQATGKVNLINASKKTYQYKWYKNDTLISTAYNTSYAHNIYKAKDTIKLVVSNGVDSAVTIQYEYFNVPPPPPPPITGWVVNATNINDNLLDVRFFGQVGIVIGTKGIYYTQSGANNASGWNKSIITTSSADSALLTRTRFKQLAFDDWGPIFYAVGNDTVNHIPVILKIDLNSTPTYSFVYKGGAGNTLNAIVLVTGGYQYQYDVVAVGANGLVVDYNSLGGTSIWNEYDHTNLISVFVRTTPGDPFSKMGILSSSNVLYVGKFAGGITLNGTYNMPPGVIEGVNEYEYFDFIISKKTLYHGSDYGTSTYDSITQIMSPINFNCISRSYVTSDHSAYIGTDSGIYQINYYGSLSPLNGREAIEYQPTSLHKQINNIWFKQRGSVNDTGYAVGNNGTLLSTINSGGPVIPFVRITSLHGGCSGDAINLSGLYGSASSCSWYVDNSLASSACGSASLKINGNGNHNIKYIVGNSSGVYDTATQTIYIGTPGNINLPVTISDSILCKSESIFIHIQSTQPGYKYELVNGAGNSFGYYFSNSTNVYFNSLPISKTDNYFIRVTDTLSGCIRTFTNPIHIVVEHTKSIFTADKINLATGEAVSFYSHSLETKNYMWSFGAGSDSTLSTLSNPSNIFYSSTGDKSITLISISANGCKDTLVSNCISVYEKPVPDNNCFVNVIEDSNGDPEGIAQLTGTADNGFIVCGVGTTPVLASQYGKTNQIGSPSSTYLIRYSTDGAVKWYDYLTTGNIYSSAVDESGNIYITGECLVNAYFYFNNGDSMLLGAFSHGDSLGQAGKHNGFILKVDSNGKYLWNAVMDDPSSVSVGYPVQGGFGTRVIVKNRRVLLAGTSLANLSYAINGTEYPIYSLKNSVYANDNQNNYVLELKDDGTLIWSSYFHNTATNHIRGIHDIGFDKFNNAYVEGLYEDGTVIYGSSGVILNLPGTFADAHSYILKYDSLGNLLWNVHIADQVLLNAMAVDESGNCYVTGSSSVSDSTQSFQVVSANATSTNVSFSPYYLLKFNYDGIYIWGEGSKYGSGSGGSAIHLKGSDIYTDGSSYNNVIMTSSNNNNTSFTIDGTQFFIADYDTAGVLKKLASSGPNSGGYLHPGSIFVDSKNNIIVGGTNDNGNGGTNHYKVFSDSIVTNGYDMFLAKLNPDFCTPGPQEICSNDTIILTNNLTGNTYQWEVNEGTGFRSIGSGINDAVFYKNTNSQFLQINGIPSNWNTYQYRCLVDGKYSNVTPLKVTDYWTGKISSSWENPSNWSCGTVPDAYTDVIINNGTVVVNSNVTIRSLSISPKVSFTVMTPYVFTVAH